METRMPDGTLYVEKFENAKTLFARFAELAAQGGKVEYMKLPQDLELAPEPPFIDNVEIRHIDRTYPVASAGPRIKPGQGQKYPAHQGAREAERRLRQLTKEQAK